MSDLRSFRARLPLLDERAYFASHSVGPAPTDLFRDLDDYRRSLTLGRRALPEWMGRLYQAIGLCERLLGAPSGSVAIRDNATAAQAAIAAAVAPTPERNRIVITELDFPSARYMWKAQTRRGFVVSGRRRADRRERDEGRRGGRRRQQVAVRRQRRSRVLVRAARALPRARVSRLVRARVTGRLRR